MPTARLTLTKARAWRAEQHPRARDGRFIRVGDHVHVSAPGGGPGGRARVVGVVDRDHVRVEVPGGQVRTVRTDQVSHRQPRAALRVSKPQPATRPATRPAPARRGARLQARPAPTRDRPAAAGPRPDDQPAPRGVAVDPLPAGTATARPIFYPADRRAVIALGLDADPDQPPQVRQAAARVRERMPLSAAQAAALADVVRRHADRPAATPTQRRAGHRTARWLDAAAAEVHGAAPPDVPDGRGKPEKTGPRDLTAGDTIAIADRGGAVAVAKVTGVKPVGKEIIELGLEHQDGTAETRQVSFRQAVWLLPDPPPDVPVPPPGPRLEHITTDRLKVGDVVRWRNGHDYEVRQLVPAEGTDHGGYIGQLTLTPEEAAAGHNPWEAPAVLDDAQMLEHEYGWPSVVRVRRGPAAQSQPWDAVMHPETPTTVKYNQVRVGDRITLTDEYVDHITGTVMKVERLDRSVNVVIATDHGHVYWRYIGVGADNETATRLVAAGDNVRARIEQLEADRADRATADKVAMRLDNLASSVYEVAAGNGMLGAQSSLDHTLRELNKTQFDFQIHEAARRIARELAPNSDEALHGALVDRITPAVRQVADKAHNAVRDGVRGATPLPGETDGDARYRVLRQFKFSAPTSVSDHVGAARGLTRLRRRAGLAGQAAPGDQQGTPDLPRVPDLPPDVDLQARMRAYRDALGGEQFGRKAVRRAMFKPPTLEQLESGRLPDPEDAVLHLEDRAADGGPGEHAMAQLGILRAAGADLHTELKRRQAGGADLERQLADAEQEIAEGRRRISQRTATYTAWRQEFLDRAAQEAGYSSWVNLENQSAEAAGAEAARLRGLRDRIIDEMTRARREASTEVIDKINAAVRRAKDLRVRVGDARRDAAISLLRDVRPGGVGGVNIQWHDTKGKPLTERHQLVKALRFAEASYPAAWLRRFRDHGAVRGWRVGSIARGHYNDLNREIRLSKGNVQTTGGGEYGDVAVHEMGHGMEQAVPGLLAAQEALLWDRTATGRPGERERQPLAQLYEGRSEYAYKDDFPEPYTGKTYALSAGGRSSAYEVFTTSMESLMGGSAYLDDDLTRWLLGTLALL